MRLGSFVSFDRSIWFPTAILFFSSEARGGALGHRGGLVVWRGRRYRPCSQPPPPPMMLMRALPWGRARPGMGTAWYLEEWEVQTHSLGSSRSQTDKSTFDRKCEQFIPFPPGHIQEVSFIELGMAIPIPTPTPTHMWEREKLDLFPGKMELVASFKQGSVNDAGGCEKIKIFF